MVRLDGAFARGRGLDACAAAVAPADADPLLLFIDVDMVFDSGFLHRCRATAVPRAQIYWPVVFSLYREPRDLEAEMHNAGMWRDFGFGMACMYRKDYVAIGACGRRTPPPPPPTRATGRYNTSVVGWGKEDVELYESAVRAEELEVVRAVDEGMLHQWHPKECNRTALPDDQYVMCLGSAATLEGDKAALAALVAQHRSTKG